MLKYTLTAAALKFFSLSPHTRRLYRLLGNTVGERMRAKRGLSPSYIKRARLLKETIEKHDAIAAGDAVLEVGTGWIHWESLIARLFYDVQATLFDVWDNRALEALTGAAMALEPVIDQELAVEPEKRERVHDLLYRIAAVRSFEELYELLGFCYVIEPSGALSGLDSDSFAAIYSCNVLEHVSAEILESYILDFGRLLKPGGYSIHTIDISDHLALYDSGASKKRYLRYSERAWKRFYENDVQYFNRVQRSEWLKLFQRAGLELIEEESEYVELDGLDIAESYAPYEQEDLECVLLRVVHRKPG
jgi:hypothetical protein